MVHCEVCHGSTEAIPILDPLDVEDVYSHIAACNHSPQWDVQSYDWHSASFGEQQDFLEGRLVCCCEDISTVAVQILHWSNCNNGDEYHFGTYPQSIAEVAIERMPDTGMDICPKYDTFYNSHYQPAFPKNVENEYCTKHWSVPIHKPGSVPNSNLIPSSTLSGFCPSFLDPYDLCSEGEEYLTPNNMAVTTPGWSDCAAHSFTAARLYLNSPHEASQTWGQINTNLKDYRSDPIDICSIFWIPDITDWWCQQDETHSEYADLLNVAHYIRLITADGVRVEASFSLRWDVIGWRLLKTTCRTLPEKANVREIARARNSISAGNNAVLDTKNTEDN